MEIYLVLPQQTFTRSNSTIETLENGGKYFQLTIKTLERRY